MSSMTMGRSLASVFPLLIHCFRPYIQVSDRQWVNFAHRANCPPASLFFLRVAFRYPSPSVVRGFLFSTVSFSAPSSKTICPALTGVAQCTWHRPAKRKVTGFSVRAQAQVVGSVPDWGSIREPTNCCFSAALMFLSLSLKIHKYIDTYICK